MKKTFCIALIMIVCCNMISTTYAEVTENPKADNNVCYENEYIFEEGMLKSVCERGDVLIENEFCNGLRIEKRGLNNCRFIYDENNKLTLEIRNGIEIEYFYKYNSEFQSPELIGFGYLGENYYYTRDNYNRINGIVNEKKSIVTQYVYELNTNKVENVLKEENNKWVNCTDKDFIGNINKMRNICSYYDEESGLYYENAVFYDAETNTIVMDKNEGISILSYGDDLDSIINEWQQSLLNDNNFNSGVSYCSTWYEGLSDVEIVARVIYGENTRVSKDQDAIAWVIRNRASEWGMSARDVVLERYQFSAAGVPNNPAYNTIKVQNSGEIGWANAVYMACLLCYSLDEYDWGVLGAKPSGMDDQMYYRAWYCYEYFSGSDPMYYDGTAVCKVYIAGYGYVDSYDELNDIIDSYSDRNIYFSYY